MKKTLGAGILAAGIFLVFFGPTFILVTRGLAQTQLTSSSITFTQSPPPVSVAPAATVPTTTVTTSKKTTTTASASTTAPAAATSTARFTTISVNGQSFKAEISDTPALQELGLSYRPSLPANQVMLFVFQSAEQWGIWMKGMNFPLDVLWLDDTGKVVYMVPDMTPATYPNVFMPTSPALYVVEANIGWIAANNIVLGTSVILGK